MSDENCEEPTEPAPEDEVEWETRLKGDDLSGLLGFDLSEETGEDRSGLRALINSALVAHRRLPMLDIVFDRTARQMTTSLRHFTNDNVDVRLDDISSTRFGDFVHNLSAPAIVAVLKSEALNNSLLFAADAALVYSMIDLLLGGRRGAALTFEDRNFTQIELGLIEKVVTLVAADVDAAFRPVADLQVTLDRVETKPRFAAIVQDASVCALAKFTIEMDERGGRAAILAPHATLEPITKALAREFSGGADDAHDLWRDHLAKEIAAAGVGLDIVLAEKDMALGALARLSVGDTIAFPGAAPGAVEIRAGSACVALGRVGRRGDRLAVRLGERIAAQREEAA